ncbi:MAG TPA: DUF4157 domain-containing protein [Thermoanaerobaculia bacterium]|nr:DUF4157 domain-containing protein [Thermoanaerobaculia bacterium]
MKAVVQRKCGCGGTCGACSNEKKKVQRRALGDTMPGLPSSVTRVLGEPGAPLDPNTRTMMESRFGHSFADVRVHTDTHAAASAAAIDAAAYTAGTHIVFGTRRFEPHTTEGRRLLAHELAHVVQQRNGTALPEGVGPANDPHEREADRVADAVVARGPAFTPPAIAPATRHVIRREVDEERTPERQPLIVEDSTAPAPSQMRRGEFVEQLDTAICVTADEEMARLGQSTRGCPLLERWRPRIRGMNARTLESALRRWSGLHHARTARDYIPAVQRRLARSIALWGATGRIIGVDADLLDLLGGTGPIRIGVGSLLRGAIGGLFRKARNGAAAPSHAAVLLDGGTALDPRTASRMGSAFGRDFSNVRVHTGAEAADTASRMSARAFTIGDDIAFANGEYRPGTIVGDALLAHELAHVVQQDGADHPATKSASATGALEHDADHAAVHAVASLWPSVRQYARGLRANAMPRLKSSLQLQRCANPPAFTRANATTATRTRAEAACPTLEARGAADGFTHSCCTQNMLDEILDLHPYAIAKVDNALAALRRLRQQNPPADLVQKLQQHFHVAPSDPAVTGIIMPFYERMRVRMTSSTVGFRCFDHSDGDCRGANAFTSGCERHAADPRLITFCGDYREGAAGRAYIGREQGAAIGTVIHEYAHATCIYDPIAPSTQAGDPLGNPERPPGPAAEIEAGPTEVYRYGRRGDERSDYTALGAERARHMADPYRWFAMEVPNA